MTITREDLYDKLTDIRDRVIRIEESTKDVKEDLKTHDNRLTAVERKIWYGSGMAAVGAFLLSKFDWFKG